MSWDTLGAIGEFFGAILVAVSLIYLAGQVRLANRISRAEARRELNSRLTDLNSAAMVDPVFRGAFTKAFSHGAVRADLNEDERMALGMYLAGAFGVLDQTWHEVQEGLIQREVFEAPQQIFHMPYARSAWPVLRGNHSEEAARAIEDMLGFERP